MPTWKKILVDGDAVADNLATANLLQAASPRTYDLNGNETNLLFKNGVVKFSNSSNAVNYQFDNANGVFDARSANGIRLSDADNAQYVNIKPKSETVASYTITLPNAVPGAANKILESNATGELSWIDTPSGGGSVTINSNVNNYLVTASGSANTLNGESNLTYSTDLSITSGKIKIATNNKFIEGALAGGASFPLIGVNTSDEVVVGNTTSRAVTLEGVATITRGVNNDSSALSSIGHYGSGADITFLGAAQTSVYQGRLYYWNGTTWTGYTPATEPPQGTLLGVSIGTTMASGFVLRGMVYSGSSLSTGKPVYGDQGATPTTTPPTSGFQRIIGHSVSTNVYYFNPSQEYIEIAQ
jgi:hypothetical protein